MVRFDEKEYNFTYMEKEPKLEDYGLDSNSYENYRVQKKILEEELLKYKSKRYYNSVWAGIFVFGGIIAGLIFKSWIIFVIGLIVGTIAETIEISPKEKKAEEIKKIKDKEIREKLDSIKNKVIHFEESCKDYYLNYLEQFYQNNLYKKRSGNEKFEHSISEFSSMIDEVKDISNKLMFIKMQSDLLSYKEYITGRQIDHKYQINKKFNSFNEIKDYTKNGTPSIEIEKPKETKDDKAKFVLKYMPPEKRYVTPRKIDNWEEINKKRKETGDKGEEIAIAIERDFLESVNRKDLADKIRHVSLETGDGLGYDILSFWENGKEKYIEVKSTTVNINLPFNISRNELNFLKEHKEDAFIYRILITEKEPEFVAIPSYIVLDGEITATSFLVKVE